jgi:hypothetical protein
MARTSIIFGGVAAAIVFAAISLARADSHTLVRTQSGNTRCALSSSQVVCQYLPGYPQAPVEPPSNCPPPPGTYLHCTSGLHWDQAVVTAGGTFNWENGNIPGTPQVVANDVVLNYGQTYHIEGWTVLPSEEGTRFTNDGTGRGMFVSIDNVSKF